MFERTGRDKAERRGQAGGRSPRTRARLGFESLEARALLTASLAAIGPQTSPAALGLQVPLDGSQGGAPIAQFAVTSDNPAVKATVAKGQFLNINVNHASSGAGDPAFSGTLVFQLFDDLTPLTTSKIEQLVNSGFYTNKNFHRVSAGFPDSTHYIAQGGSVSGTGLDQPPAPGQPGGLPATGYPFADEFNLQLAFDGSGQLAMANAGPNTNASQFFITTGQPRNLDFHHTIFGQLVAGGNVLTEITHVAKSTTDGTTPVTEILITSASLTPATPYGVIHIDTTGAAQGQTANIHVVATDPTTSTTATQSFQVTVGPTAAPPPDPYMNERAFLAPVPASINVGTNQTAVFKINGVDAEPTDVLTYTVQGGLDPATGAFTPVQNATATVDANGVVTVVPNTNYTGPINLLLGVRDQVNRSGNTATPDAPSNFQTHTTTVNVSTSATHVDQTPIALPVTVSATANTPTTIQLAGNNANPGTTQTLTYTVVSQPAHGTISRLNPSTGQLTYTANLNYIGPDTFNYTVTTAGGSQNLTSPAAAVSINVTLGQTHAVRLINRVLVITPPPRFDGKTNTIDVTEVNGNVQVTVNGVIDANQPAATALDRIVIYGGNHGDNIAVEPSVTVQTTLDGGHGGRNSIRAGGGPSRIHAWFGQNLVSGGTKQNDIVGRKGHVQVLKSLGTDNVFLSNVDPGHRPPHTPGKHHNIRPPAFPKSAGSFYKFVGNRLVKTNQPATTPLSQA